MSRWTPPWMLGSLGYNPRQYATVLGPQGVTMQAWQQGARPELRAKLQRLPQRVLETLFRRLRRWTWYRDIGGQRYYLLYRGLKPAELSAAGGVSSGSRVTFVERASYTPDPNIAINFASRYNSRAVGIWVPESAIVTAPYALGREYARDYNHGELEIIVDPYTGFLQDERISPNDFCREEENQTCKYRGWMGDEKHPWFIESGRRLEEFNRRADAGKDVSGYTLQILNPGAYRIRPPTPDSKTSRGF